MSPEFQKIMFDPFSRADDHRTTRVQGTGLGMAISRNIVNLMNGNIKVESILHKGTRITVTIYLELQEKEDTCTMCGKMCAVRNINKILRGEDVDIMD